MVQMNSLDMLIFGRTAMLSYVNLCSKVICMGLNPHGIIDDHLNGIPYLDE